LRGDADRTRLDGVVAGLLAQERDFECAPPRRGEAREDLVCDTFEEIAQRRVREPLFGLRGP
jgi:hypothetical protein